MAFDKGFDFRGTTGFVTDPPGATYVLGDSYPTTRNGVTFGWTFFPGTVAGADESNTVDPRLAGINSSASQNHFEIDLPAPGKYIFYCALGNAGAAQPSYIVSVRDPPNTIWSMLPPATLAGQFSDPNGNVWSAAQWPANQTGVLLTFAGSVCDILFARSTAPQWVVAHVRLVQAPAFLAAGSLGQFSLSGKNAFNKLRPGGLGGAFLLGGGAAGPGVRPAGLGGAFLLGGGQAGARAAAPAATGAFVLTGGQAERKRPPPIGEAGSFALTGGEAFVACLHPLAVGLGVKAGLRGPLSNG
jgi:hypothetical protein